MRYKQREWYVMALPGTEPNIVIMDAAINTNSVARMVRGCDGVLITLRTYKNTTGSSVKAESPITTRYTIVRSR